MNQNLETFQKNIRKLSELAAEWRPDQESSCGVPLVMRTERGNVISYVLHERESVSIVKIYIEPRVTIPIHMHDSKEVLVLFEGSGTYESVDVLRELVPGSCISIEGGKAHKFTAGEDGAWFSATLVPREKGFDRG